MRATSRHFPTRPGILRGALVAACLCRSTEPTLAQYSQPIFLEAARDPGRAEAAVTARSLALGGARASSGLADDALASPASLTFGQGVDLVVAGGPLSFARDELSVTPSQTPPWLPGRVTSARSTTPIGYIAIAARRAKWAVAGFIDGTTRYSHEFETASAVLRFATVQGVGFLERGSGRASASTAVRRMGGAFAVAPWRRLSVGVSVYGIQLDHRVSADVDVENSANDYTDFTFRHRSTTFESDRVDFGGWGPGFVVSAAARPIQALTIAARWRREPSFAAVRELTRRQVPLTTGTVQLQRIEQDVTFQLPGVYAVAGTISIGRTVVVTELARVDYGAVFGPDSQSPVSSSCEVLRTIFCSGWAFGSHRTADATTWRAGVEQSLPVRRSTIRLRAGVAVEQGYTLARSATDPSRSGGSSPAPPVVSAFEPPRESSEWLSFGGGYAWRHVEIGLGVGYAEHRRIVLADVRLRM